MTTITVRDGQKPTKEQLKEIRAAAKAPITYTPDCPESTPEALAEFAAKARELRQNMKRTKPAVTIRITPGCLTKYKALGKGYTLRGGYAQAFPPCPRYAGKRNTYGE
jgi:uncharacterized protein (DUF4415 family)